MKYFILSVLFVICCSITAAALSGGIVAVVLVLETLVEIGIAILLVWAFLFIAYVLL